MTSVLVTMAIVLGVAILSLVYAAFPHRREPLPGATWLGDVMEKAADAVPTIDDGDLDPTPAVQAPAQAPASPGPTDEELLTAFEREPTSRR